MEESTLIDQECIFIKDVNKSLTNDQVKISLDTIVVELNKIQALTNAAIIKEIVTAISIRSSHDRVFSNANLLNHQIFLIIRAFYLNIMCRWRRGEKLDQCSSDVFSQIAILFSDLCCHGTNTDVDSLKELLIDEPIINELCICLKEIGIDGKHLQDEHVESIDYYLRGINYLSKGRIEIQSLRIMSNLLDTIINCICSNYFLNMFKQIDQLEKLNAVQTLLLDTCTDFISWHDAGHYNKTHIAVRTALLNPFISWFENHLLSFEKLNKVTIKILGQLSITIIGGNASDEEIFSHEIREDYCKMIDQLSSMLNSIVESEMTNENSIDLTRVLSQCLYSLTMTNDLRTYIKNKHIVPLLLKLTNFQDETIQFHVYRILAAILTEEDIKTLTNSSKIANVFLKFLSNLIDDSSRTPRFYNLLRSLKILIQHDQIKEELIKQEILPLLFRCAIESKFDSIKVQLPALEILLALTFNAEAARQLKHNSKFIANLKILSTSSTEQRLQRVAEGIIWKLEKEPTAMAKPDSSSIITNNHNKTYDVMLSYSHSDKDLCYRIHDRLLQDQFRVWIDRDQMHGQTMVAMANAIENSDILFICMSDAYKQSAYCQSEAHYAFERQCLLIPLIMKSNYRPDGWLGILVSGKIYIDFPKLGFDLAYEKLKNEVNRQRANRIETIPRNKSVQYGMTIGTQIFKRTSKRNSDIQPTSDRNYPEYIDQWTTDNVRAFLINEKLNSLLPVLGNMNGHLIHEIYKRCKAHWEFMFQTFKSEVAADGQHKILTMETYIRFIDEIEKYIPDRTRYSSSTKSSICILL